eukprot:gnl/Dysnectes_brevis/8703_a15666_230.p1 GENE.gnl/Dysnectes_brevis/8703_a15666_230~~gnl/Dysnectes_brevis/8703_a15666_230.p1  ORF type:complete len:1067 (+),score=144.34 gnl/Dysnectes_brevis/8703_a15666_230:225-3203(+)
MYYRSYADHIIQQFSVLPRVFGINYTSDEHVQSSSHLIRIRCQIHQASDIVQVCVSNIQLRTPLSSPFLAKQRSTARRDMIATTSYSSGAALQLLDSVSSVDRSGGVFELDGDLHEDKCWGKIRAPTDQSANRALMIMLPMLCRVIQGTTPSRKICVRLGATGEFIYSKAYAVGACKQAKSGHPSIRKYIEQLFRRPFDSHSSLRSKLPITFKCGRTFDAFDVNPQKHLTSERYCIVIKATVNPFCAPPVPLAHSPSHVLAAVLPTIQSLRQDVPHYPVYVRLQKDPDLVVPAYFTSAQLTSGPYLDYPPMCYSRSPGAHLRVCLEGTDMPGSCLIREEELVVSEAVIDILRDNGTRLCDYDQANETAVGNSKPFLFLNDGESPATTITTDECPALLELLTREPPGATLVSDMFNPLTEEEQVQQLRAYVESGAFTRPTMGSLPPCVARAWTEGSVKKEATYVTYHANRISGASLNILSRLLGSETHLTLTLWVRLDQDHLAALANELHAWACKRLLHVNLLVEHRDHTLVKGISRGMSALQSSGGLIIHAVHYLCRKPALNLRFRPHLPRHREPLLFLGRAFSLESEFKDILTDLANPSTHIHISDDYSLLPFLLTIGAKKVQWLKDARSALQKALRKTHESVGAVIIACVFSAAPICFSDIVDLELATKVKEFLEGSGLSWVRPLCVSESAIFAAVDLKLFEPRERVHHLLAFFDHDLVPKPTKAEVLRAIVRAKTSSRVYKRGKNCLVSSFSEDPELHSSLCQIVARGLDLLPEWTPSDLINFGRVLRDLGDLENALKIVSRERAFTIDRLSGYDWYNLSSFVLDLYVRGFQANMFRLIDTKVAGAALAVMMLLPHHDLYGKECPPPNSKLLVANFARLLVDNIGSLVKLDPESPDPSLPKLIHLSRWLLGMKTGENLMEELFSFLPETLSFESRYEMDYLDFVDYSELESFGQERHIWMGVMSDDLPLNAENITVLSNLSLSLVANDE